MEEKIIKNTDEAFLKSLKDYVNAVVKSNFEQRELIGSKLNDDRVYSIKEAAERLGCSRSKIDKMIKGGDIQHVMIGDQKKIRHDELKRVLEGRGKND